MGDHSDSDCAFRYISLEDELTVEPDFELSKSRLGTRCLSFRDRCDNQVVIDSADRFFAPFLLREVDYLQFLWGESNRVLVSPAQYILDLRHQKKEVLGEELGGSVQVQVVRVSKAQSLILCDQLSEV